MLKAGPEPPFHANAKCWPSGERLGVCFSPTLATIGVTIALLSLIERLRYTVNSSATAQTHMPPRTAILPVNRHCDGLRWAPGIAADAATSPMNRYPRRASVSMKMGFSADSPNASRNLLIAALRL